VRRGVRISGPASDEFTEAVRWYETRRPGLGAALYGAVNATIEGIERQPEIGTAAYLDPQTRRMLVVRFPYQVVYHLHRDEIVIVAIAHLKRRPGYWKHRRPGPR
jgi:plasmid stabilization system protein ParE